MFVLEVLVRYVKIIAIGIALESCKYINPSSTLKKDKVAVTLVSTGFPPLLISKKMLYGNATLKYF